jgi:hypothetical protein
MHFLLIYEVVNNYVEKRVPYRKDHLSLIQKAFDAGEIVLAGALAEPADGAVLVFRGPGPEAAERFARADPYVINGVVTSWRIRKWSTVVGDGATLPSL